jgi:hypothetical protein
MSKRIHKLAQQLFDKPSVEECTLEEVNDLAQRFPYFAPAQFLLLEKLKQSGSPQYDTQLQKAVLYYHDPLIFEYFISSDRFYTELNMEEIHEKEMEEDSIMEQYAEPVDPILNIPSLEMPDKETPAFEPFHTVDYFASQGIKLSQEEIPKDKFGKQLKSFTEWLRTMKRLPSKDIIQNLDPGYESNVQHLAEDSVHESDVYTESMAEVWLKQGNNTKALEVYNKLSLLNPSKRAYFAAKIENLKS